MKYRETILVILAALYSSLALAEDFKTINGKEYKNATVSRIEADGIVLRTKGGISKVYFTELPKEVQERFHYNPQTATAYSAQQAAQYEVYQKQQEEVRHRQEDADAQNRANIAQQQAANARAQAKEDRELVRQQQSALGKANRHRPADRSHGYTTVVKPLFR